MFSKHNKFKACKPRKKLDSLTLNVWLPGCEVWGGPERSKASLLDDGGTELFTCCVNICCFCCEGAKLKEVACGRNE